MRISDWSSDVCSSDLMPFDSGRFDTVVTTFTLCSVADQAAVLAEIRRVLKPGGTALFLEHGGAPDAGVARWQRRIEPLWKRIGGNCHLTRPITHAYSAAGFAVDRRVAHYMPKNDRKTPRLNSSHKCATRM